MADATGQVDTEKILLAEWRAKHRIGILNKCKKALERIRDAKSGMKKVTCPLCSEDIEIPWVTARDCESASRTLIRMVSGLQLDQKAPAVTKEAIDITIDPNEISQEDADELERLINGDVAKDFAKG